MSQNDEPQSQQQIQDEREFESPILKYFDHFHLPSHLQSISYPFYELAHNIERNTPPGPEKSAGLRKLLESKDCIVRAFL